MTSTDIDPCAATGARIEWQHPGFPGRGHFDYRDETLTILASPITSPFVDVPPADWNFWRYVCAVDDDAGQEACEFVDVWDWGGVLDDPVITRIRDRVRCEPGAAIISVQGDLPPRSALEIHRDGAPFVVPWYLGAFDPLDALPHDYVVRVTDLTCGGGTVESAPFRWQSLQGCVPGEALDLRVARGVPAGEVRLTWTAAADASAHDILVGTVGGLFATGAYDHVAMRPGVTFVGAPIPSSGCFAVASPSTTGRVAGLQALDAYFLVVGVGAGGARGSFGRDSQGNERSAIDPRPTPCR